MWLDPRRWLAASRVRRRAVLYVLLPVFILSAAPGSACAAMRATPHAAQHAPAAHAHHGHAAHGAQPAAPQPHTCPHCPLQAADVGHGTCAATESPDHGGFAPAKDTTERPSLALAPNWSLPAARAAPPLIANLHPPPTAPTRAVPLNIAHCVLLI
jgi:hypothetical protein